MSQVVNSCGPHILVVDDEEDTLDILEQALTGFGYRVSTASSAETALDMTREQSFDMAVCDMYLMGMSGGQFVRAIGRMHPQMPVILVTAHTDLAASRESLAAGAADFITKPIELDCLPLTLENSLQRKKFELARLSEQRADVLFKAVKALAAAIDARSHYTGRHSARMAELCMRIGTAMCLPEDRLNALELSAHIHDVGKIDTPDSVLMKPDALSDEEWADVLRHPAMGADFLSGIDELAEVASIVRHHHEHMDGSGYPDGLKGEAIPLLARILCAADALEAMTSDRPYRDAMSLEGALDELRANSGTQFDPLVVEAAVRVVSEEIARERKAA